MLINKIEIDEDNYTESITIKILDGTSIQQTENLLSFLFRNCLNLTKLKILGAVNIK